MPRDRDTDDRLCGVFEMLVERLTRIESQQEDQRHGVKQLVDALRYQDDMQPADGVVSYNLHCNPDRSSPLNSVIKNYPTKALPDWVLVAVVEGHLLAEERSTAMFDEIAAADPKSSWRADLQAAWGTDQLTSVIQKAQVAAAAAHNPFWFLTKCVEVGVVGAAHERLDHEIIETVMKRRIPGIVALGEGLEGESTTIVYKRPENERMGDVTIAEVVQVVADVFAQFDAVPTGTVQLFCEHSLFLMITQACARGNKADVTTEWEALGDMDREMFQRYNPGTIEGRRHFINRTAFEFIS